MAELAGSIIGIVSVGTKVALVLSQLASDIGSAGQEARMISSEIQTFCTILNTLKDTMETIQNSQYYAHCFDVVRGMTDASVQMFTEVLNAAETLRAVAKGKDGRFSFVNKVHWVVFQKPKVVVLRAAMEAYKSNIALMLGTINTVEKVARRMSFPQTPNTINQDDQERTSLQSLELDCRTSMISLEQAENEYSKYTMNHPAEEGPSLLEHPLSSTTTFTDMVTDNEHVRDSKHRQSSLVYMARMEITSMRSSLVWESEEHETLQVQMIRHNRRLSLLMQEDHQRLSQRWSTLFDSHSNELVGGSGPKDHILQDQFGESLTVEGETVFVRFQEWFLCQPWSEQDKMLETLRADLFSDRHPGGYNHLANNSTRSIQRLNDPSATNPIAWEHKDSSLIKDEPSQYTQDVQARPFIHERQIPTRPWITIQHTGTSSTLQSLKKPGMPEHRRSRSHDVPRPKDAGIPTRSAGHFHGNYEISSAGAEHEQSPPFDKHVDEFFLEHIRRRNASKSGNKLGNGKVRESPGELLSPTSPRDGTSRRPLSSLVGTTREEKGYSKFSDSSPATTKMT